MSFAPLCPHCGAPAPSIDALRNGYRCGYCERIVDATANPAGAGALPGASPAPKRAPPVDVRRPDIGNHDMPRQSKSGARFAPFLVVGLFLVFIMFSPKTCATVMLSGETKSALDAVRKCPRAMALLGDDPAPSWVGCTTGKSNSGCDSGSGNWSIAVAGSRARGELGISASKHKSGWRAEMVILSVENTRVEVVSCSDLPKDKDD